MKKLLVASIAAAALCSAPALAADMPVKAAPVAMFNWSGMYVGVDGGYSWGSTDNSYYLVPCPLGCVTRHPKGGVVGPVLGIQAQTGNWVWGVEGSWNLSDEKQTGPDAPAFPGFTYTSKIQNFWTVGPRVGYASGNWLLYMTGGYADAAIHDYYSIAGVNIGLQTARHGGWFIGGGVDTYVAKNTILGIEYKHLDFDSGMHVGGPVLVAGTSRTVSAKDDVVLARLTFKMLPPFGTGTK